MTDEARVLGRTGLRVSPLCLGAMGLGSWGTSDPRDATRIVHRALDAGITFIDTADVYSDGESEELVGRALSGGRRDQVVVATKFNRPMGPAPHQRGNSRAWVMQAVDASLRRLRTDYIDLYQAHRHDPDTDVDETLGALTDLVRAGKIRYFGSSTFPASEIVEAQWVAERRGRERFACDQSPYSLLVRHVEAEIFPTLQRHGMGAITWSPLAGGWLSGRYRAGQPLPTSTRAGRVPGRFDMADPRNQRKLEVVEALALLAEDLGLSLVHLAIAFVLRHPAVTSAIIGPRTLDHLESQLGAEVVELSDETLDRIDAIVAPGETVNAEDLFWEPPALADPALRRRPTRPSLSA